MWSRSCRLRRALQSASAQLQRPHSSGRAIKRSSISCRRSTASHVLLPHVQRRFCDAVTKRCVQTLPRVDRPLDRFDPAGRHDRHGRARVAEGRRVRLPSEMEAFGLQFGHGLGLHLHERPVISRLNSIDHPAKSRRHGLCARDVLSGVGRLLRSAHRGRDRRDLGRSEDHHALPGPRTLHRQCYDYGGQPR